MPRRRVRSSDRPADGARVVPLRYHQIAQITLLAQQTGQTEDLVAGRALEVGLRFCCRAADIGLEQVMAEAARLRAAAGVSRGVR
jgi:hypothetical protein